MEYVASVNATMKQNDMFLQIMKQKTILELPGIFIIVSLLILAILGLVFFNYVIFMQYYKHEYNCENGEEIKSSVIDELKTPIEVFPDKGTNTTKVSLILRKKKNNNIFSQYFYEIPMKDIDNLNHFVKKILYKRYVKYFKKMEQLVASEMKVIEQKIKNRLMTEKPTLVKDIYLLNCAIMENAYYNASTHNFFIEVVEIDAENNKTSWEIQKFGQILADIDKNYNNEELAINKTFFSKITLEKYIIYAFNEITNVR